MDTLDSPSRHRTLFPFPKPPVEMGLLSREEGNSQVLHGTSAPINACFQVSFAILI